MNTFDIDFKFLVESDSSPLIVFNHNGHIEYLNSNAEILMSYVNTKGIFDLAVKNAPKDYGSNTTQVELKYGHLKFYSINVSYINDEWIAIRLYYRPREYIQVDNSNKENLVLTDLNRLLDVAIIQFKIDASTDIRLFTDKDIPKTLINQNSFLKLLRVVLSQFRAVSYLDIALKLGIGEHIVMDGKRYPLVNLEFISNGRYCNDDKEIESLSKELCLVSSLDENSISLEIPLIRN